MTKSTGRPSFRILTAVSLLALLAACDEPLDFDMRGKIGAFSTAPAAQSATGTRPAADNRGVISYPNYQVAVARRGDTVTAVANRVGLPASELARYNGLTPGDTLRDGEILALPSRVAEPSAATGLDIASLAGSAIDASPSTSNSVQTTALPPAAASKPAQVQAAEPVRHRVARGETAYTIARLYNVPVKSLAEWNGLGSDFSIREGQYLMIPVAGAAAPKPAPIVADTTVTEPGEGSPTPLPPSAAKPLPAEKVAPRTEEVAQTVTIDKPTKNPASNAAMGMPVQGKIIRTYSKGKNEGIDIAASPGSPVNAAADGSVAAITSSADQVPIVVVRHPDNLLTVYANVEGIKVKKGDTVKRGQQLAELRGGDNAYVHFEVRNGFDSVNPQPYLE
ncbi:peptidoglycan DD-metalloendopeptidase family protein [Sulfitobacter sp. BDSS02]|nr:peptidoglycan DD-metalloendopeptidase family protein [Sulfitobacter sp. BDSS02]MBR9852157.1 peptidoglycan DD-metalloendopeptidase family protein [Paracoccaceae bacterium]